jgi:hypothetical protein
MIIEITDMDKFAEMIAEKVTKRINQTKDVDLDAAYLASLSNSEYNLLMRPRMKASKEKRK